MKRSITKDDLLPLDEFAKVRSQKRREMIEIKKNRRASVGPDVTLYFENFETLRWQIQEMLYIEKGGEAQIEDELLAYTPLVPQGHELVATLMIEIDDPVRRTRVLSELGGIEYHLCLRFAGHTLKAIPEEDPNRTTASGKTSSVHFLRWQLTPDQAVDFSIPHQDIIVEITHPHYSYKTLLPDPVRASLSRDL